MLAHLVVISIIIGCLAHQCLKSTLIKSFLTVIAAICAGVIAFNYFEPLAGLFITYGRGITWIPSGCFLLLFIFSLVIFRTGAGLLLRRTIKFNLLLERIGKAVCGLFLGLIISGVLLTIVALTPIPSNWPYARFDRVNPDSAKPNKVLFNVDGFVAGIFRMLSNGTFSGNKSFALFHPDFADQIFLNRHNVRDGVTTIAGSQAVQVPRKDACWFAPGTLRDIATDQHIRPKSACNLAILRAGIKAGSVKDGGAADEKGNVRFSPSQLRLICKQKSRDKNPFAGNGLNTYPVGYITANDRLQRLRLDDDITIDRNNFTSQRGYGRIRWIDFAFFIPNNFVPVLLEFKQNSTAAVPSLIPTGRAPAPVPFVQISRCAKDKAQINPVSFAQVYGIELAAGKSLLSDLFFPIGKIEEWQEAEKMTFGIETQFDENQKITYTQVLLTQPQEEEKERGRRAAGPKKARSKRSKAQDFLKMLKPLPGYKLLSLKCNNPSTGMVIRAEQLPVLVELDGKAHHVVGIVAAGKLDNEIVYEVDYCSLTTKDVIDGLVIAEDGSVARPFPDLWLTKQARSITALYLLYLVKPAEPTIITSVRLARAESAASFKNHQGFLVKK